MEERLDRYCVSIEWFVLFLMAEMIHLDEKLLDQLSIHLKLNIMEDLLLGGNRSVSSRTHGLWRRFVW